MIPLAGCVLYRWYCYPTLEGKPLYIHRNTFSKIFKNQNPYLYYNLKKVQESLFRKISRFNPANRSEHKVRNTPKNRTPHQRKRIECIFLQKTTVATLPHPTLSANYLVGFGKPYPSGTHSPLRVGFLATSVAPFIENGL